MPAPSARASVKLILRKEKLRADGTAPVYLRVTADRKSRYTATGVSVRPSDWNPKQQRVRASHDISETLNATLADLQHEAQGIALTAPSATAVKAAIDGPGGSLTAYFERFLDMLRGKGETAYWEVKKYKTTLSKLRGALGAEVSWREVDRDALARFERYCCQTKKNGPNMVRKELTRLRRVYKEAIRDGVIPSADDPFHTYQKPKAQRVERRKLSLAEVGLLEGLRPDDGLVAGSFEEAVRDAFVFAFYCGGMRFGDVCLLKASGVSGGRANYRMMKTGTPMSVPLPSPAVQIAERFAPAASAHGGFLFPFLAKGDDADGIKLRKRISSLNAQTNTALKVLAALAGMEPEGLSFHVSRHSFADYARSKSGDLYAVSKSLGHGNLQTTETYLKAFDRDAVDKLANDLWT